MLNVECIFQINVNQIDKRPAVCTMLRKYLYLCFIGLIRNGGISNSVLFLNWPVQSALAADFIRPTTTRHQTETSGPNFNAKFFLKSKTSLSRVQSTVLKFKVKIEIIRYSRSLFIAVSVIQPQVRGS